VAPFYYISRFPDHKGWTLIHQVVNYDGISEQKGGFLGVAAHDFRKSILNGEQLEAICSLIYVKY